MNDKTKCLVCGVVGKLVCEACIPGVGLRGEVLKLCIKRAAKAEFADVQAAAEAIPANVYALGAAIMVDIERKNPFPNG